MGERPKRWYQSEAAGCGLVILIWAGFFFLQRPVTNLFRLDGGDTVYEFQTASAEAQVSFLMRACHDGECITRTDWACGFSLDDGSEVTDCISDIADQAKPWVTLDAIRKLCGQRFMTFEGALYGDPEDCRKRHGTWGRPSPAPRVVF